MLKRPNLVIIPTLIQKMRFEGTLWDIEEKDKDVKDFISSSSPLLQGNKYDEGAVTVIDVKLKEFCNKWDKLKESYNEKKIKKIKNYTVGGCCTWTLGARRGTYRKN